MARGWVGMGGMDGCGTHVSHCEPMDRTGSVFAPLESYRAEDKLTLPGQRT
jgi:hypothetical protein